MLISQCFYKEKDLLQPDPTGKIQLQRPEVSKYMTMPISDSSASTVE